MPSARTVGYSGRSWYGGGASTKLTFANYGTGTVEFGPWAMATPEQPRRRVSGAPGEGEEQHGRGPCMGPTLGRVLRAEGRGDGRRGRCYSLCDDSRGSVADSNSGGYGADRSGSSLSVGGEIGRQWRRGGVDAEVGRGSATWCRFPLPGDQLQVDNPSTSSLGED